jgi:hypothetical protein
MAPKTKAPKQEVEPQQEVTPKPVKKAKQAKAPIEQVQAPKEQAQAPIEQVQAPKEQAQAQAVSIVLIETNGTIKTLKTKEVSLDTLYKKCGFRVNEDFLCRHTWAVTLKGTKENYKISLWGKKTGKANFENKYDLPPPLDKDLFFGTCALVRTSAAGSSSGGTGANNTLLDLTKETWQKIYEQLFGGFEDIGDEDEYSEDELANVDPALLTKDGYLKDDFVVSDTVSAATSAGESAESDASASEADPSASEDDDSDSNASIRKTKPVKKKVVKKGGKKVKEEEPEDTSELEEEVYTFSDDDNL